MFARSGNGRSALASYVSGLAREHRASVIAVVIALVLWELTGQLRLVGGGSLPSLTGTLGELFSQWGAISRHTWGTLRNAGVGFLTGSGVGVALAVLFALSPIAERLLRVILISLFSVPLVIIAPIVALSFGGEIPKMVLSALAVYFPVLVGTHVGLHNVDPAIIDVVHTAGGGRWQVLWRARLRASIPGMLAGMRLGAPAAVLGAILGEFLGGQWGLGVYMLGSMTRGDPEQLWAISVVATACAAVGYAFFAVLGSRFTATTKALNLVSSAGVETVESVYTRGRSLLRRSGYAIGSLAVALLAWVGYIEFVGLSSVIAKGPTDIWQYLVTDEKGSERVSDLVSALGATLPTAGLGLVIGLSVAFGLAVLLSVRPAVAQALMPMSLVLQSTPLVMLTPVIALLFGRGLTATLAIATSVIFFSAFVIISQGLANAPGNALDLMRSYNASALATLGKISVPNAMPYLFAAMRLSVPRALLAVVLAEFLATGEGLGLLLLEARGQLKFGMMWSIAVVTVIISVALYRVVSQAEDWAFARFGAG